MLFRSITPRRRSQSISVPRRSSTSLLGGAARKLVKRSGEEVHDLRAIGSISCSIRMAKTLANIMPRRGGGIFQRSRLLSALTASASIGDATRRFRVRSLIVETSWAELARLMSGPTFDAISDEALSLAGLAALALGPTPVSNSGPLPEAEWITLQGTVHAYRLATSNPRGWIADLKKSATADSSALAAWSIAMLFRSQGEQSPMLLQIPGRSPVRFNADGASFEKFLLLGAQHKMSWWSPREQELLRWATGVDAMQRAIAAMKKAPAGTWPQDGDAALTMASLVVTRIDWEKWLDAPMSAVSVAETDNSLAGAQMVPVSDTALQWGVQIGGTAAIGSDGAIVREKCCAALLARNPKDQIARVGVCHEINSRCQYLKSCLNGLQPPSEIQKQLGNLAQLAETYACDPSTKTNLAICQAQAQLEQSALEFMEKSFGALALTETARGIGEALSAAEREAGGHSKTAQVGRMRQLKDRAAEKQEIMSRAVEFRRYMVVFDKDVFAARLMGWPAVLAQYNREYDEYRRRVEEFDKIMRDPRRRKQMMGAAEDMAFGTGGVSVGPPDPPRDPLIPAYALAEDMLNKGEINLVTNASHEVLKAEEAERAKMAQEAEEARGNTTPSVVDPIKNGTSE